MLQIDDFPQKISNVPLSDLYPKIVAWYIVRRWIYTYKLWIILLIKIYNFDGLWKVNFGCVKKVLSSKSMKCNISLRTGNVSDCTNAAYRISFSFTIDDTQWFFISVTRIYHKKRTLIRIILFWFRGFLYLWSFEFALLGGMTVIEQGYAFSVEKCSREQLNSNFKLKINSIMICPMIYLFSRCLFSVKKLFM